MAKKQDWVPHSRDELYKKVTVTTVPYINGHLTPLGMAKGTPLGDWYANTFLTEAFNPYDAAYAEWSNPKTRTSLIVEQMNGAEKVFIPVYRRLFRLMTGNLLATDPDLEGMGFPKRPDGSRTPAPVATEAPGFDLTPLGGHRLRADYYTAGSAHKKAKPDGQRGVEIRWAFSETPVHSPTHLPNSLFDTATPYIFEFDGDDQGRLLYIAMRWENTRGEKGPWSIVHEVTVP